MIGIGIGINFASRSRRRGWSPGDAGASLLSWMRGDDPGATINTAPTPHQYAAIPGRGALGGVYEQATSADQPQVSEVWSPGAAPLFAEARRMVHSGNASEWTFLHGGSTDFLIAGVFRLPSLGNRRIFYTFNSSSSNVGAILGVTTAGALTYLVGNGSGSAHALSISSPNGTIQADSTHQWGVRRAGSTISLLVDGSEIASGTPASPSTDGPQLRLSVGNATSSTDMHLPEMVAFTGILPDAGDVLSYLSRWSYTP